MDLKFNSINLCPRCREAPDVEPYSTRDMWKIGCCGFYVFHAEFETAVKRWNGEITKIIAGWVS